jgi:chromosomal replication initiation ATPase DnaA
MEEKANKIKQILTDASNKISECTIRKFALRIDYPDSPVLAQEFIRFLETEKIITTASLKSGSRKQNLNYIRQSVAKILVEHEHLSSSKVGEMLNRNHSTIIHYVNSNSFYFKSEYNVILHLYEAFLDKYYSTGKC